MSMSRRSAVLGIVIIALVIAAGLWWHFSRRSDSASASAAPAPPAVTVSAPLRQEITEWDEYTGQFAAVEYVELRARVSGYLQEIHFDDGQIVKQGDLLFVIDPRPFQTALDNAKAQEQQAQARLDLANRQLARAGELRQRDFVAQATYDERLEEMRAATASLEASRAAIRRAELDLEYTRIVAPTAGRIGRHLVSTGNLISADQSLLTTIVSLDPMYFHFDMSESDYLAYQRAEAHGRMRSQREGIVSVFVRLADETSWTRRGQMDFIDNQVDRTTGTIRARAIIPNSEFLIVPGQFGRIRVPGSEPYTATLIPDSAVVTDQSRKLVLTVGEDGTVVPKIIRPGPGYEGLRIVRRGLEPTDRIIINGLVRARPGAKVTPEPGKIETAQGG